MGLDSDVIIELVCEAGIRHKATHASYESLLANGAEFVVTDHALLEAFSVLSRSPAPVRVAPAQAERMLKQTLGSHRIAPIRAGLAWETIRHTVERGFLGGRVYDAIIALATYEAGASALLTWNVKHFLTVAPVGLEIRHP